jgi:hypothetical protein
MHLVSGVADSDLQPWEFRGFQYQALVSILDFVALLTSASFTDLGFQYQALVSILDFVALTEH